MQMILHQSVTSVSGKLVPLKADTICIHGDGAHAVEYACNIHPVLKEKGIEIKAI